VRGFFRFGVRTGYRSGRLGVALVLFGGTGIAL
jgi:hypothetical protein